MGTRMGHAAVKVLEEGKSKRVVALHGGEIVDIDIEEAPRLTRSKDLNQSLFEAQQVFLQFNRIKRTEQTLCPLFS